MLAAVVLIGSAAASAAPVLQMTSLANTTVAPGGTIDYFVTVTNVGDEATNGDLTLTATFPPGVTAASSGIYGDETVWSCASPVPGDSTVSCTYFPEPMFGITGIQDPHSTATRRTFVRISANVDPSASGVLTSSFTVTGGGAADATVVDPTVISATAPSFGVDAFDGQVAADPAGTPFTQAGGHPYSASTTILFNTLTNPNPFNGQTWPVEPTKDIIVGLPPGFVVNPTATGEAKCTPVQLANSEAVNSKPLCPTGSQIGVASVYTSNGSISLANPQPVYNMVPPPGVPARLGFNVLGTVVTIDGGVRSGSDYGLSATVHNVSEGLAITGTTLTLWGVPSDPSHNLERACPGQDIPAVAGPTCTTESPRRPFLRNPTSCTPFGVGLPTTLAIDSWFNPGVFRTASFASHNPPAYPTPPSEWGGQQGPDRCDLVPFSPSLSGTPDDPAAGSPSGFSFDLTLPQSEDPDAIATADLKQAVVTLPKGLRTSASLASGLGACSPTEIGLKSDAAPSCPSSSKIGTVTIDTPLLDDPLTGSIYLATPHNNPFNSLVAIYLVAQGPGVVVKLAGNVTPDARNGQITTSFDSNPELPFSRLHLAFKGGPRAPLSVPPGCGNYSTRAELTSWSGKTVVSTSSFDVSRDGHGAPCGGPKFSPGFSAGVTAIQAGKNTSFKVRLTRDDVDQELSGLTITTPRGLLAKIAGVPLCDSDKADAGTCPAGSLIGSVVTGAGAGPSPFYLPGKVYLTESYNHGPFGLSIVVPAIAGPFDLGTVVVRASIRIDRYTAQLHVVADPLPTILEGIPLQIRDVRVTIDRSKFMVNPTGCEQKRVAATVTSTESKQADVSDRFQVGGCSKLPLQPKLALAIGSKGHTRRGTSTPLTTTLTQTPGQSNLKSVFVSLPLTLNALLPVVQNACTQADYEAGRCGKARVGSAVAVTPLLDKPLRGSVYFVKTAKRGALPNLVVALRGQVDFDLIGKVQIPGGVRLATSFDTVPDVPITSFKLSLVGGAKSPLGVVTNLCTARARRTPARVVMHGQNGDVIARNQRLAIRGCGRTK